MTQRNYYNDLPYYYNGWPRLADWTWGINVELLKLGMKAVEEAAVQGTWNQKTWRCGTSMCFAGWVIEISGREWVPGTQHVVATPEEIADGDAFYSDGGAMAMAPSAVAQDLLGITSTWANTLFHENNTLNDLRHMVDSLTRIAERSLEEA